MTTPTLQASLDQLAAAVRDSYDELRVNIHDPEIAHAIRVTYWLLNVNPEWRTWVMAAIGEVIK